ncbi:tuberin [Anopheles ziemanni]|uniref:tuberin n=1 Tax=Anopheles coustani TaxID=139045 RepID=UPI0026598EAD|nr:tuberin [Anopheles coustani]XP_058174576.1 tuberin [Anopheles ziemanni]
MTSRERETHLYRLKQFFRITRSGSVSSSRNDLPISPELERELRPETPVTQRCKALKDFGEQVMSSRLEPDAVQSLWELTKDLLVGNKLMEQRQCALAFYCKLIQGQYDSLGLMRAQFYRVIVSHSEPEDIGYRLEMLKQLTDTGKQIQNFEKEIGPFLLEWIKPIDEAGLIDPLLELIVNLIKYNAASLEPKFLVGVVSYIFDMTCKKQETSTILLCLSVLDCFICYAIIPNESLTLFIIILCRMVNQEAYCQHSWKIMKNLFGTALGHATLLTMCNILNNPAFHQDDALLRGAIFHTNVGLWGVGGCVVPILNCSPSLVLTSFWNALKSRHVVVTYEVILSMNRLIQKSGTELNEPTWDIICDIMTEISHNLAIHRLPAEHTVLTHFHDTLNIMEGILQQGAMNADPEKIYALIEKVSAERPEASVKRLIDYKASKISATRSEWLRQLCQFMDRFYRMKNSNVRIYAVQALERIMAANRAAYEDEILERIVIVHLGSVPLEKDAEVRKAVARTLIEFTIHCETKRCIELLEIIEKLLHRPYEENHEVRTEHEVEDVILLVDGLIRLFIVKLYRLPSLHAIRVYSMLIGLLELHYQKPNVLANVSTIRYRIFAWMMKARANGSFHIGYPDPEDDNRVRFSHYLGIEGPYQHQSLQPQPYLSSQSSSQLNLTDQPGGGAERSSLDRIPATNLTTISIKRGCQVIVLCLKEEKDWEVIQLVLTELPNVMQNKALIQGNDVDSLARTLYRMYTDRMQLEKLQVPANMLPKVSDYMELILPALSSLAMYHQHLDFNTQKNIIEALKLGLISRRAQDCIRTLTILLLEMPEQLMPKMADLLLEQSKMTSTKTVALPVLEFLSTLILVPSFRFGNFNTRTYMCVLAMSLPYTNPFRYDHYTVSLAHYVVAAWFIKCKLPMRHQLVKFIVQGLESYVKVPFQDGSRSFSQANEDSSERKRSSSLTEQSSRRRDRIQAQQQQQQQAQAQAQQQSQGQQKSQQQHQLSNTPGGQLLQQQGQQQAGPKGTGVSGVSVSSSSSTQRVYPVSGLNDDMCKFHCELAETCVDFMVRHTFSPCSGISKRLPSAEFLLSGGQSMTWLVGHDLITITTSGCSGVNFRNGLCDRCHQYCVAAGVTSATAGHDAKLHQHQQQQHHPAPPPPSSLHQSHPMLSKSNSSASTTTTTIGGQPLSPEPPSSSSASSGKDSGLSGIGATTHHHLAAASMATDHTDGKLPAVENGGTVAALSTATSNKRYTKASLQHSSANESDSTDLTTSSSTSSSTAATPFPAGPHSAHSAGPMSAGAGGSASTVGSSTGGNRFFRQGSQEGYSSGSLEALSRRGSNPDSVDHGGPPGAAGGAGGGELLRTSSLVAPRGPPGLMATIGNRLILPQQLGGSMTAGGSSSSSGIGFDRPVQPCACVCTGWAEVSVRRPTGYTSWITRIQSQVSHDILGGDVALQDLTCLFSPSVGGGMIGSEFSTYSGASVPHGYGAAGDSLTPFGSNADIPATMTDRFAHSDAPNAGSVDQMNPPSNVASPPVSASAIGAVGSRAKVSISDDVFELTKKSDPKKKHSVEEEHEQSEDEELKNVLQAGESGSLSGGGSGPINIPRNKHPAAVSDDDDDGDEDDDDDDDDDDDGEDDSDDERRESSGRGRYDDHHEGVVFDDPEGRSMRKTVRRVNSSPEMGSKWNSKYLSKAAAKADISGPPLTMVDAGAGGGGGGGGVGTNETFTNTTVNAPVQPEGSMVEKKKSSTYGKGVSCEAIPEEIAGSTPPPPSMLRTLGAAPTVDPILSTVAPTVRGTMAAKHQAEFSAAKSAITTSLPETNTLEPPAGGLAPRKQHSADDAMAPGTNQSRSTLLDGGASNETINLPPGTGAASMVPAANTIAPIALHPITQTSSASALSLKLPMEKVTSKPPQSPVPLSPRLLARNTANLKQSNSGTASPSFPSMMAGGGIGGGTGIGGAGSNDNDVPRGRSKTISTVREHYSRDGSKWSASNVARMRNEPLSRTVVSPSFVFLQLYHHGQFGPERPVLMDKDPEKAIALLDLIPPFEMHKIGVLYVGPGQAGNETEILKNRYGSLRYAEFLSSLGTLVAIKDAKEKNIFIDLESNGKDGAFTYIYQDDIVQITFHVATLMPNKKQDPHCNEKKKHIGNDFVTIVYNESGEHYDLKTIKGQYNYACVVVEPIELNSNRVFVRSKDDISQHVTRETKIVSDHTAPLLARQMALHANLASLVAQSLKTKNSSPYASNWLERLRKIKNIRSRYGQQLLEQEQQKQQLQQQQQLQQGGSANDLSSTASTLGGGIMYRVDDFSKYTV